MGREVKKRPSHLPVLVISGASGFIGRYFLNALCEDFYIYALARRPQKTADVPFHGNISWIRVDIANKPDIDRVIGEISENGGADFFLHLAGFFDFIISMIPNISTRMFWVLNTFWKLLRA